jgi:ribose 1,5-bisphosphokinase
MDTALSETVVRPFAPGVFVAVAGPSGAGKDTLLDCARLAFADDEKYVFVRRLITRPSGPGEDCLGVTPQELDDLAAKGALALSWRAHGLDYAIPASADHQVANGQVIIANLSRSAIPIARNRYQNFKSIYIDAALDIRATRLSARSRENVEDIRARLARSSDFDRNEADLLIENNGAIAKAAATLIDFLKRLA